MVLYSAGAPGPATVKGSKFNAPVALDTDIFASDIKPTYSPTTFRIYACFDDDGVLKVIRKKGIDIVSEHLNGDGALTANAAYTFDVIVESGESMNVQYDPNIPPTPANSCTCIALKVLEVPGAVS